MRVFYFLFLIIFTGAVGILAYENQHEINLQVFNQTFAIQLPLLVGLSYLAGMVSGWTVVGMLQRSVYHLTRDPLPDEYASSR